MVYLLRMNQLTVFFDGSCPLCRREIALLQRLDRHQRVVFENVATDVAPSCPIGRDALLARFHAQLPDGTMISGARAFTEAYAQIFGLGFIRWLGRNPVTGGALDWLYRGFLRVRPALQRLAGG